MTLIIDQDLKSFSYRRRSIETKLISNRKKTPYFLLIILTAVFNLTAAAVQAQQPLPRESGFSGYIELLGAYFSTNSQLNTDDKNKRTDSLDKSGRRVNKVRPIPLGLISYTFADIRTQLYLGLLPENVTQGQFSIEAGIRHDLTDGTSLRAAFIPMTPIKEETWRDPFVVNQNREDTDITSYGFNLAADSIKGTGLNLRVGWVRATIDDEESGRFLLSQPDSFLTTDDLDDLRRDSNLYRFTGEYSFRLGRRMRLKPILRYTRGDAKGDANSFHGLNPQLSLLYFRDQLQVALNAAVNGEWYDDTHPVFDKTRRDLNLGLFAILGYKDPFSFKNFRVDWFNGIFRQNSNIDFFESTSWLTALGVGYEF